MPSPVTFKWDATVQQIIQDQKLGELIYVEVHPAPQDFQLLAHAQITSTVVSSSVYQCPVTQNAIKCTPQLVSQVDLFASADGKQSIAYWGRFANAQPTPSWSGSSLMSSLHKSYSPW